MPDLYKAFAPLFNPNDESRLITHSKSRLTAEKKRTKISTMKPTTVLGLLIANLAGAVDMSPYKAGTGVEAGFATFVEE